MTTKERSQIILDSILALLPAPLAGFNYDYALAVVVAQLEAELEDWVKLTLDKKDSTI